MPTLPLKSSCNRFDGRSFQVTLLIAVRCGCTCVFTSIAQAGAEAGAPPEAESDKSRQMLLPTPILVAVLVVAQLQRNFGKLHATYSSAGN